MWEEGQHLTTAWVKYHKIIPHFLESHINQRTFWWLTEGQIIMMVMTPFLTYTVQWTQNRMAVLKNKHIPRLLRRGLFTLAEAQSFAISFKKRKEVFWDGHRLFLNYYAQSSLCDTPTLHQGASKEISSKKQVEQHLFTVGNAICSDLSQFLTRTLTPSPPI